MGLSIGMYGSSYGTLHELRAWVLQYVANRDDLVRKERDGDMEPDYDKIGEMIKQMGGYKEASKKIPFFSFIEHSDCEGGYINSDIFGGAELSEETLESCMWGDLNQLKKECAVIKKHAHKIPEEWKRLALLAFIHDVEEEDGVLLFR